VSYPAAAKEAFMATFMDFRHRRGSYFHPHPWHEVFALVATLALAALMVMALATSAH
jgi:hypothetical protein